MFMRNFSHAPRQNYRDIADQFDRMGNMAFANPAFAGFAGNPAAAAAMMQATGMDPATAAALACGAGPCCPVPEPTVGRVTLVGFPKVCIPGCDCETVETSVCGPFTLTNLFIPEKIASCLSITRFRIGCWDLLVNCDPVPAELFSCCELDDNMFGARPVDANSPICLTVENECKADIPFTGAIKGVLCDAC